MSWLSDLLSSIRHRLSGAPAVPMPQPVPVPETRPVAPASASIAGSSRLGRGFVAREEACVLTAYRDSVGVWTIFVGHTSAAGTPAVTAGMSGDLATAFQVFGRDVRKYELAVLAAVKVRLTQSQLDALVSWHLNTGAVARASLIKRLNAGDYRGAADGLLEWKNAGGKPILLGRRQRERALFLTGDYGSPLIPVYTRLGLPARLMPLPASA